MYCFSRIARDKEGISIFFILQKDMYEISYFREIKIYQVMRPVVKDIIKESKLFYVKNIKCLIFKSSFSRQK